MVDEEQWRMDQLSWRVDGWIIGGWSLVSAVDPTLIENCGVSATLRECTSRRARVAGPKSLSSKSLETSTTANYRRRPRPKFHRDFPEISQRFPRNCSVANHRNLQLLSLLYHRIRERVKEQCLGTMLRTMFRNHGPYSSSFATVRHTIQ